MSETAQRTAERTDTELANRNRLDTDAQDSVDSEALLSVLSDDHARDILVTISEEALPAREIADRLDISKPTVYRRLNRLEDVGVLSTSLAYDPDGHHRQQYCATLGRVVLSVDAERINIEHAT